MNCKSETTKLDPTMVNELLYPANVSPKPCLVLRHVVGLITT